MHALATTREASDIAAAYKMETVAGTADLVTATVLAVRCDNEEVPSLLARVRSAVDEAAYRGFTARIRHAAGLAALAQGSYLAAYAQLSQQFAPKAGSRPHRTGSRPPRPANPTAETPLARQT